MDSGGDINGNDFGGGKRCITSFVDGGSVESHRYFLARRTVLEMLRDRGYIIPESELALSLSDFRSAFGHKPDLERLRVCAFLRSNPTKKILVIFCGTDEIRKQTMVGILNQIIDKDSLHRVVLILQSKMNFHARKLVDEYSVRVETFQITDLLVNITKHVVWPKHKILAAEEKQTLVKKYNVEDNQFPRMLENDAIARYYALEKGQVVKVSYSGTFTDSLVTYRCVT
ncbi:DNA-directed RNA polymerase V subunit 5A-like [Actinidia eriantha]|uniref:DNA-directed RNA polymerase V subunit 5A-like n=1 Tax=Actinidia eriantha TaxID=165200 RepID=UPI00258DA97C|nr:DNA-directed RNA polymerase V subunit 5A-like [Actinidia eriantha]